jgi:multiple sugar transport system permease protein
MLASGSAASDRPTRRVLSTNAQEAIWAYIFLLPALLGLVIFTAGPLLAAFALSLTKYEVTTPPVWVGLQNYAKLLHDEDLLGAFKNTLYYAALVVPSILVGALGLALLMNRGIRGISIYRAIFYAPAVCSSVGVSLLWAYLYNPQIGVLNYILGQVGIPRQLFIESINEAMPSIAVLAVWRLSGYFMVVFLAALYGVPREYYEAAKIDGAGRWEQFRRITMPMISPATFFVVVILLISALQVFDEIYVMTKGGPGSATQTLIYIVYTLAFQQYAMGYACAVATVVFLLILALTVLQLRFQSRWVHYE